MPIKAFAKIATPRMKLPKLLSFAMFCFMALCSVATTAYARERSEEAKDSFKYVRQMAIITVPARAM
jgi:hypothetical protein